MTTRTGAADTAAEAQGLAHFQLYAADWQADIRWRLLSANNRELGRGYVAHPSAEACVLAIKEMLVILDELVPQVRRREGNMWQWTLLDDEVVVAIGGHPYDRQIRSHEAVGRFRLHARTARVGESVMLTGSRRWVRPPVGAGPMLTSSAADRERTIRPIAR